MGAKRPHANEYTVRQIRTGLYAYDRPGTGWCWHTKRTYVPRDQAEEMAARLSGIACDCAGIPLGVAKPKRPPMPKGKAAGEPDTTAEALGKLVADENWREALRVAAKLSRLGDDRDAIQRAWQAWARPDFAKQIGRNVEADKAAGIEAIKRRFGPGAGPR